MDLDKEACDNDTLTNEFFHKKYKGVGERVDIDKDFILVSLHPVTTEINDQRQQTEIMLDALEDYSLPTIMLWPNFDAGSNDVSKAIRTFREKRKPSWLSVYTNFSVEDYSRLLNRTKCMVGNSSSAIREGNFLDAPSVNIGSRQNKRIKGLNLIDCDFDKDQIKECIANRLKYKRHINPNDLYGDGNAGAKIKKIIENFSINTVQKTITY